MIWSPNESHRQYWMALTSLVPAARLIFITRNPVSLTLRSMPDFQTAQQAEQERVSNCRRRGFCKKGLGNRVMWEIDKLMNITNELLQQALVASTRHPTFIVAHDRMVKKPLDFLTDLEEFVGRRFGSKEAVVELITKHRYAHLCPTTPGI